MKKPLLILATIFMTFVLVTCKKDETTTDNLNLLTSHIWLADSLLADGADASGVGGLLEKFKGDTKFNEDGTGYVGEIIGTWQFTDNEGAIIITSDSLPIAVTTKIAELTGQSLKLTTTFPVQTTPTLITAAVRMTFKPK